MAFSKKVGEKTYAVKHSKTGKTLKTFRGEDAGRKARAHAKKIDRRKK
jgi:hypothetical protein